MIWRTILWLICIGTLLGAVYSFYWAAWAFREAMAIATSPDNLFWVAAFVYLLMGVFFLALSFFVWAKLLRR